MKIQKKKKIGGGGGGGGSGVRFGGWVILSEILHLQGLKYKKGQ